MMLETIATRYFTGGLKCSKVARGVNWQTNLDYITFLFACMTLSWYLG